MSASAELPSVSDLDAEQGELTEEYLRAKAEGSEDRKAKRALQKLVGRLNTLYWNRVRVHLSERARGGNDSLSFTEDERLLIDMGLLDTALVEDATENLRDRLLEELGTPGAVNHYYLSEWLEDRYKRFLLTEQMSDGAGPATDETDSELGHLQEARGRIYTNLKPYFTGLPGVPEAVAAHVVSGQLDDQIQLMSISLLREGDRPAFVRRHNLRQLRTQILAKLRARLKQEKDFKLVDMLDTIYAKTWSEYHQRFEQGGLNDTSEIDAAALGLTKRCEYLEGELKFARNLLPLGALAGGIPKPISVLLKDEPRITKRHTGTELQRAREADRGFTADPVVLIAPYCGRGFFEWDRDSVFVPLVPVADPNDAIAHATGNYRMLIDSLQEDGHLKAAYEGAFSGANFQQSFQEDYRTWICGVGRGNPDAMAPDHFAFFRQHVGPDCDGVLAPANLRNLGPGARASLRGRLEKQIALGAADANIHYRLGILCWQEGNASAALEQIARAVALDATNGMATFSLGLLLRHIGAPDKARRAFTVCRTRLPDTIWATYASRFLEDADG